MKQHYAILITLMTVSLLLTGCGGGGGSNGGNTASVPTAPVALTAANAETAASAAAGDLSTANDIGNTAATGLTLSIARRQHRPFRLLPFAHKQLQWLTQQEVTPAMISGFAITTSPLPCDNPGGTVTVTLEDNDGNVKMSNGDSLSLSFNNCFDNGDQTTTNGTMKLALGNVTGNPRTDQTWSASVTLTMNNLTVGDNINNASLQGDITLTISATNLVDFNGSLSGTSFTVSENGVTESLQDYRLDFTTNDASGAYTIAAQGTLASSELNGSVNFETTTTFSGVEPAYPDTGVLVITGAGNSSVTLTAIDSTNVTLDVDEDGDGITDKTINTTWAQLDI